MKGGMLKKYEKGKNYLYKYIHVYTITIEVFKYFGSMFMLKIELLTSSSYFYTSIIHNLLLFFKVVICFATVD